MTDTETTMGAAGVAGSIVPAQPETAIVPTGINDKLAQMTPDELDAKTAMIIKAAAAQKQLVLAAITRTYNHDWKDFGDKPYLEGNGAERMASIGIRISAPLFEVTAEGDDFFVEALVEATWPAMDLQATGLGDCNTQDKFFKGKIRDDGTPDRSTYHQYLDETGGNMQLAKRMLLGRVKKKAHQNAISRAVCAVMGIRGLTWEDLSAMGITKQGAGGAVTFQAGAVHSPSVQPLSSQNPAMAQEAPAAPPPAAHQAADDCVSIRSLLAQPLLTAAPGIAGRVVAVKNTPRTNIWTIHDGSGQVEIMVWAEKGCQAIPVTLADPANSYAMARDLWKKEYNGKIQYTAKLVVAIDPRGAQAEPAETPF